MSTRSAFQPRTFLPHCRRAHIFRLNATSSRRHAFSQKQSQAAFSHDKIGPTEIRLLKQSHAGHGQGLQYSLETYGLDVAPPYTALSYMWGEDPACKQILLNEKSFAVRSNLWWALHHIRRQAQWDYVWVDAICIDQQSVGERNEQVQVMDRIYRNADTVTAWLGLPGVPPRSEVHDIQDSPNWSLAENFVDIARRPYWSRSWVVQELLVAKDIQLMIGEHCFDFEYLKSLVTTDSGERIALSEKKALLEVAPFIHSRDGDRFPQWSQPLYGLLISHRHSKCRDRRDKIFSLLNLIPGHEQRILRQFFPNYSLTREEVFAITLAFLRNVSGRTSNAELDNVFEALGIDSTGPRQQLVAESTLWDSRFTQIIMELETGSFSNMVPTAVQGQEYWTFRGTPRHRSSSRRESGQLMSETRLRNIWTAVVEMLVAWKAAKVPRQARWFAAVVSCVGAIAIASRWL